MAKKFIIGIDLGGTNLKIALLDLRYDIRSKNSLSTRGFTKKKDLILGILDAIAVIIKENSLRKRDILGVGLGLPGPVDAAGGVVYSLTNIPGWKNVPLKRLLEASLRLPVFLDNDAKIMTLAEHALGNAKGYQNAVCITLGTGVGGGIIIGGSIYRGQDNAAGELGHLPINEEGPKCNCPGLACLEAYIGNNRIAGYVQEAFKRRIPLEEVSRMAKKGNRKAKMLWYNVGTHLGTALVGITNLLNPDVIVIGGGVSGAGEVLFSRVREVVLKRAMTVQAKRVRIVKAKLGADAGLIGAAVLVKIQEGFKE